MQINTITLALLGLLAGNTVLAAPSVEERAVTKSHDGTLVCGNFATGTKKDVYNLTNDLSDGGKIGNKRFTVGPRSCQRIHCWNTSAVYICNVHYHLPTPSTPPLLFSLFFFGACPIL